MRRASPPYIINRGGVFYLRMRVPIMLLDHLGVGEVRRSLRVGRLSEARLLGPVYAARLKETFAVIHRDQLTRPRAVAAIQSCFANLDREVGTGFVPVSNDPWGEVQEQRSMASEGLIELERQIECRRFDTAVVGRAQMTLGQLGIALPSAGQARDDLVLIVARALAEQQRLYMSRLDDPFAPYQPKDLLLSSAIDCTRPIMAPAVPTVTPARGIGLGLSELVDAYLKAKKASWTPKTHASNAVKLRFLVEHLGEETPALAVSSEDLHGYGEAVLRLRSNHHLGGRTFAARQTMALDHRIKPKTAVLIVETAKAMFRWAKRKGHVVSNPAADLVLDLPKVPKGKKARRPFTAAELTTLFKAPLFTGCKSRHRRMEPGGTILRDAYFWVPVLGFYTGMRLGELVQLHMADVHLEGPVAHLEVTEDAAGARGSGTEKHVKSEAGVRRVPLHPDLLELGFGEFVNKRSRAHSDKVRLFFEVGFGADGQASSRFSKWFGRLLDAVGLDDPALVFHSFRHGIEDAFRNNLTPQYVIDRIVGHADGSVSSGYGDGVSLEVAGAAVRALKLGVSVRELVPPLPSKASATTV